MKLWSVNATAPAPICTAWRYELGPVVVDAPHVPHCGGSGWEPVKQADALCKVLERAAPGERGIDLNNLLIPCCYHTPDPRRRFAARETVYDGFVSGTLHYDAPWKVNGDVMPDQVEQLVTLASHLDAIGGVDFIWCGEPENFTADFVEFGLLKEIIRSSEWQEREPPDSYQIDDAVLADPMRDFAAFNRWHKAVSASLRRIVVLSARKLLRAAGIIGTRPLNQYTRNPTIAWPFGNTATAKVPLLGGNGELLNFQGGLDNKGTITGYLFQQGSRYEPAHQLRLAVEVLARTAGQNTAHKLNMQAGTPETRADIIRLAEDMGHKNLVLWTNPGHALASANLQSAANEVAERRNELRAVGGLVLNDGSA